MGAVGNGARLRLMMASLKVFFMCAILATGGAAGSDSMLCLSGDFEHQVSDVLRYVTLSEDDLRGMSGVVADLEKTLQARWPGCKVYPFGSTVSGLGLKFSDVDVYVELQNLTRSPHNTIVVEAQRVLAIRPDLFTGFEVRPTATVPIVTLVHVPTGTYCDVNFHSASGIHNSELSGYLLGLDKRAFHLAILVKFWATVHKIVGSGRMSSYAMSLLVIFYLQQRHVLPPIASLQRSSEEVMVNNWNTAFNPMKYASKNNESLYELTGGFFKYYSRFDFNKYVVSTYLGQKLSRRLFAKTSTVPDAFSLYKINARNGLFRSLEGGKVVVQDVFEHNRNVARTVSPSLVNKMVSHFKFAAKACKLGGDRFLRAVLMAEKEPGVVVKEKNAWSGGISTTRECMKVSRVTITI